ncbi:MAG: GAF domain-containing protein, partial [Lutibacter sp.]|nr:GAF domain-containing protein [Lutibacter sp.]
MNIPQLKESVTAIAERNQSDTEKRQAICDYLKHEIDYYHWVGFYFKNGDKAEL